MNRNLSMWSQVCPWDNQHLTNFNPELRQATFAYEPDGHFGDLSDMLMFIAESLMQTQKNARKSFVVAVCRVPRMELPHTQATQTGVNTAGTPPKRFPAMELSHFVYVFSPRLLN